MADILIKNMEMPKERIMLEIFPNGRVLEINPHNNARIPTEAEAIELPPHGDLIERSPLVQKIKDEWQKIHEETGYDVKGIFWNKLVEIIESSEVVLEANNGSDN